MGYDGSGTGNTLALWQARGHDTNSIGVDPQFVDTATSPPDLHLQADSDCIDAATAAFVGKTAPSMDIDGEARPEGPGYDLGSDEYVPGPPVGSLFIVK